ncbi:MAG: hypothetical protein M3347_18775, partial [Armatimonadota bacterium]|nr:hypothetical protein [Armatimonadota bacterium]
MMSLSDHLAEWIDSYRATSGSAQAPLDAHLRGADVVFFRSSWTDPKAISIGFKGGDNKANAPHLNLGTFVL